MANSYYYQNDPIRSTTIRPYNPNEGVVTSETVTELIEKAIEDGVDLTSYAKKTDLNQYYNKAEVDAAIADVEIDVDLDDYAKTADVDSALALKANTADVQGSFANIVDSLNTKADRNAVTTLSNELNNKVSITDFNTGLSSKANVTDIPDVSGLATKAELDGYVSDDEAADLISAKLEREIVNELPTQNIATNKIYMKARA